MSTILQSPYIVQAISLLIAVMVWAASWAHRYGWLPKMHTGEHRRDLWQRVFPYIRSIVYTVALSWATYLFIRASENSPSVSVSLSGLMRQFGLTGLYLLFAALLPGLLNVYFPSFSFNALLTHSRRAIGVSAFCFAAMHGTIGFIYSLSANILSIVYLAPRYQLALLASFLAFTILMLLTATSFDRVESWMGPVKWKRLHRFVYMAAILAVIHAFLIGSHFTAPASFIPRVTNIVALALLLLEAGATFLRLVQQKRLYVIQGKRILALLVFLLIGGFWLTAFTLQKPYDPHARHRKGYSKNYSVELVTKPVVIMPNTPIELRITVRDKRNNKQVKKFQIVQEKPMHLIVISKDLQSYQHLHPELQSDGSFMGTVVLPREGTYNLYIEYSPPDFLENLSVATLTTQAAPPGERADLTIDKRSKEFTGTTVSLSPTGVVPITDTVDFSYIVSDTQTNKPVVDLQPYLAAFGHLAIVSEDGQTFTHVHPIDVPLSADQLGGPRVRFSTFFQKPGLYKLFAQFKRADEVFVTDFVIEVK